MSDLAGSPVLVTGGAGFIGSHLVEELVARGARVGVLDNLSTGYERNLASVADVIEPHRLDLVHDDLRPLLAEGGFELVFHLAANAYVPSSVEDPAADFERNAIGTFRLLEAVREASPASRLIHTSSAAIYGEGARMPMREDDPTVPVAPYGVSKLAAERYVSVYARVYGLRTANVRLFPVYGPRLRKQVVFDLIGKVHDNPNELFIYGDGSQVRDFNHVANVVASIMVVLERGELTGETYNVAADEAVAVGDLARMICEQMGAEPELVYSGDVRPGEAQRWYADTSRIQALGYEPRVRLAEGLADTVAWFREEKALA